MLNIFGSWINRYFSDEEAVLLLVFLISAFAILITMGSTLAPMFASVIIAFLLQGLVAKLRSVGMPHTAAVTITFIVLVGFIVIALLFVLPLIWDQSRALFAELPGMFAEAQELLLLLPEQYPNLIDQQQVQEIIELARSRIGAFGQEILTFSLTNAPVLIAALVYLILVPILVFFFLKDSGQILSWLSSFLPHKRPVMRKIWAEMNQQIANYVRGKVIEIFIVGAVTYVCFALLGVNYALLLGIAVGFSVVVPYIGAAVVTIPVAVIGFFQWGWSSEFYYLMGTYAVIQALDGNVLVPLLFSEAVNLHPIAIILAVLVFGGLWGFWGVFFAIPLATLFKAVVSAWPLAHKEMESEGELEN